MIEIKREESRFFTGDAVRYKKCEPEWLLEQASLAADVDMRTYAAAGLMRALLDTPVSGRDEAFRCSLEWARNVIAEVQAEANILSTPEEGVYNRVMGLPPVKGELDAVSVLATKANNPWASSLWLDKHIPEKEPKLIIGLGQGGILSSIKTFSAFRMLNEETTFYPVRFSRYKSKDEKPVLADEEIDYLKSVSADHVIVVHDEDRGLSGGSTLRHAVRSFDQIFRTSTYGFTPAIARHPSGFWPGIIHLRPYGGFDFTENPHWSSEIEDLVVEAEKVKEEVLAKAN